MPRRPSKKSKASGKPRKVNRSDSKIDKWNDISDIPLDEEDQFHASRDQILLDDDHDDADEDMEDDEVFALKGMLEDDDDDEEDVDVEMDEDLDAEPTQPSKSKKKAKAKQKGKGKGKEKESSDSEDEDSEEEEGWGRGKAAYYSSNAAQLESDDEEGHQLEEQEAKRLQIKSRDDMHDADFGLDDPVEVLAAPSIDILDELPATVSQLVLQDKKSMLRHLEKTDPASLALAGDWTDTAHALVKTKQKLEQLEAEEGPENSLALGMMHLHYQTLLAYATTLAFYLHLRAQQMYAQKPDLLKSHPVMQRLLQLKQSLITLEDLDFAVSDDEGDENDDEDDEDLSLDDLDLEDEDDLMQDARALWDGDQDEDVDSDELEQLLADAQYNAATKSKSKTEPIPASPPKKKRKPAPESGKTAVPIFDLVEPDFTSSKSSSSHLPSTSTDAFGEATSLQHADAADKTARRKTLRFHTSRIESTSARRQNARNNTLGGDDDIPYRERKKAKEERLAQEAKARVRPQGGADLDDTEPEPRKGDGEDALEGADGYYELVNKQSKAKKDKKKAEYEALREDRYVEEEAGSGPRSLTRAILANKGLTPHRPKSVRNPRVKKRERFEKAKKKVASQKAVYKGGVSATGGRYEGERSGISKVVKSVRLG